jgi:hypothetical protein
MTLRCHLQRPLNILAILSNPAEPGIGFLSTCRSDFVLFCRSLQQAERSAAAFEPDVVIIDDGIELENDRFLCQRLSRDDRSVCIIRISRDLRKPYCLSQTDEHLVMPASAVEVEFALKRIRRGIATNQILASSCA